MLKTFSNAFAKTDNSTSVYAIYGMLEADTEDKLDIPVIIKFLNMITGMKDEFPLKAKAIELITTKILDKGDSALCYLEELANKRTDLKVIVKKLIYYIESAKKIDEFEKNIKKLK
ncbi:MAG TPA: hypothetical protein VMV49_05630 [Candidatus Deferrimicrobium sp.]|nr:hypothetical protein [Candidatus Deferrimicrobium sp.]